MPRYREDGSMLVSEINYRVMFLTLQRMGKSSPYKENSCNTRGLTIRSPRCPAPEGDTRLFQSYLPFPDVGQDEFECLNLFVVRPSAAALAMHSIDAETTQLPVLIWIHGGGFKDGAGTDPVWGMC